MGSRLSRDLYHLLISNYDTILYQFCYGLYFKAFYGHNMNKKQRKKKCVNIAYVSVQFYSSVRYCASWCTGFFNMLSCGRRWAIVMYINNSRSVLL